MMQPGPSCQLPERTLRVQLPESSSAIQMENFLSLLESVDPSWLTPSSTTWAIDIIFAFVCGLGLFRLLLPLLPLDSPSPPLGENTTTKNVARREHGKARKQIRTVKAYRGSRKKPKEDKVLGSLLHSMQERLVNTSICQQLKQDASGEAFKPDAAKAHLPPRQPTGESVATNSSLETSSAPHNEHLLLQVSKPLSPVLLNSSPVESQPSVNTWPPETLTTGRRHSPPQRAPSYPSLPLDPVTCPPPMPEPSMVSPQFNWKILATSQSTPRSGLSSPMSTTPGLNLSRRPTSTAPGLDHSSRPTSTTPDLDHSNRPTSTTPGLDQLSMPISGPFRYQLAAKTLCHSNLTLDESLQEDLPLNIHKASFRTGPTCWQIEAGEPTFINPDMQKMLEVQVNKRVELKERSDLCLLHSWNSKPATITSRPFWNKNCISGQFPGQQKVFGNDLKETHTQLYWGLPFLHSESLVGMAGSPLERSSILFNGLSAYSPLHVQTKDPPQLCSPQPLLHHLVKSQPWTPKFSWSQSPPKTRIQIQARYPSSFSKLSRDSAPIRDDGASCPTPSRPQVIVPRAVEHLERHLLKKYLESMSNLPVIVKKSQEAFNQHTSYSWVSQGQGSAVHLQGKLLSPKYREQREEHLKKRLKQQQGQWPHKVQLSLDLGQAQVNHRTSCPSAQPNNSSQTPQCLLSKGPEKFQPWRNPPKDLTECLGRALKKDLYRSPDDSLGRVLEAVPETEVETCHRRHPRSNVQNVSPVGPGKKQLAGTLRNRWNSKWRQTRDTKVPEEIGRVVCLDHKHYPPVITKPNMGTWKTTSFSHSTTSTEITNAPSFLDPGTQKVLEAQVTRRLVRHRWSQRDPEKEAMKTASTVESQSTQNYPPALHLGWLSETPPRINSGPFEAPTVTQGDSMTSVFTPKTIVGRAWHSNTVNRSETDNPEPSSGQLKGIFESEERDGVTSRRNYQGVSVRVIGALSQFSRSRDTKELEEAEEEDSSEWTLPVKAVKMGNIQINPLLKTSGRLPSPSKALPQDADDAGLSTPRCSASAVVLRDGGTRKSCHDRAPKGPLAEDIPASRQDIQIKGPKPVLDHRSNNENFCDRIKRFILSILIPKCKVKQISKQKCQGLPSIAQGQGSIISKVFMSRQAAEGQDLMMTAGQILKGKLRVNHSCVPSNAVRRPVFHKRIPTTESNKNKKNSITAHLANIKVHSLSCQDKGVPYGKNQAQVSRDPVSRVSPHQQQGQVPHAPRIAVHCPRHCLYRKCII
uniref:spermatogenesis-associated protein 31-like n=1 Tax=Myodes glareolus TaxID=447135 RepID=UPI002021B13B|nr:spermatogenesis-associated protein 31-like [Myodes glareolus]